MNFFCGGDGRAFSFPGSGSALPVYNIHVGDILTYAQEMIECPVRILYLTS